MRDYLIKSMDKGLRLIDCFSSFEKELGVTELSNMLNENKTTVFSLLSTFKKHGYITQNLVTNKYRLGNRFLEKGSLVYEGLEIAHVAKPFLNKLVSQFHETVYLVSWNEKEAILIDKVSGTNSLRMSDSIGKRYELHCTAVGKMFLSSFPDERLKEFLKDQDLQQHTTNTVTDIEKLLDEIYKIKKNNYAINNEEEETGVCCICAPIKNANGQIIAAISISGVATRLINNSTMDEIIPILKEYSMVISQELGFSGNQ